MVSLFDGIENGELEQLLPCLGGRRVRFDEGDYIFMAGGRADQVGMVLSGSVLVFSDDFWGNRTIMAHVERGGLFGEAFSFARVEALPVSVTAAEKTEVLFIRNMLKILAEKNMALTQKIGHMGKRSTREKILSYLSEQAGKAGGESFSIPLNRQEMADYLAVDRSALSKELGRLEKEGQISFHKNQFQLLKAQLQE